MPNLFDQTTIHKLLEAATDTSLINRRDALLAGIHPGYVAGLQSDPTPRAQLLLDLTNMNRVSALVDGSIPMLQWLENASKLATPLPETEVFLNAYSSLNICKEDDASAPAESGGSDLVAIAPKPTMVPESKETIIYHDERLPVDFFPKGTKAFDKVALLKVPLFKGGQAVENGGKQVESSGTGWMIGDSYLITNHHVIRARSSIYTSVAENDFECQALETKVIFDYNDEDTPLSEPIKVKRLVAWDVTLDYTILELDDSFEARGHLPLRKLRLNVTPERGSEKPPYVPVNIIQHPEGKAKKVAIRSNLVTRSTERDLRYFTDTEPGASGSPVLNDGWVVVALHRASSKSDRLDGKFQGKDVARVNVGTQIAAVLEHLEANFANEWSVLEQAFTIQG